MSKPSWKVSLAETLDRLQKTDRPSRIAVMGIGNILYEDDAAGVALVEILHPLVVDHNHLLVVNAGIAPENFSGVLRRFDPALVVLADAAQMYEKPGTVRWLGWRETTGYTGSTHTLPPHILATYLTQELSCEVALLGIQPIQNRFDAALSPIVRKVVEATAHALAQILRTRAHGSQQSYSRVDTCQGTRN